MHKPVEPETARLAMSENDRSQADERKEECSCNCKQTKSSSTGAANPAYLTNYHATRVDIGNG